MLFGFGYFIALLRN